MEEWQEKGRRKPKKMKDNCYNHGENGGKWTNSEGTEEGAANNFRARISLPRPPICEGGSSWLREVTGRHGSNFLPFSGPWVGY